MSDFLYSTTRREPGALRRALAPWLAPTGAPIEERHGPWGSLAVALPPHEAHALQADDRALSVVVGSPVVRLPGRPAALLDRGDRRARVHGALEDPGACARLLDGAFAALRVEVEGDGPAGAVLVTDRIGVVAVFEAEASAPVDGAPAGSAGSAGPGRVVGTHVDAVAAAAGRSGAIDLVSAADLVANYACTWPWTLYQGVEQVEPGVVRVLPGGGGEPGRVTPYWRPVEPGTGSWPGLDASAAALREALLGSVAAATAEADRAAALLSGGEDSRAVLAAVPAGVDVRGVVYAEWESREVRVARAVARAHGARLELARRAPDHYAAGFEGAVRLAGSGHLFVDVHGLGLELDPPLGGEPVVLGGLSADSLLKGGYAPGAYGGGFRSKRLPGLRPELLEAVDARRAAALDRLREWRPETAEEWLWLWPFSMRKHSGNVEGNRRLFRSWEAFHATAVLEVAAALRPEDARGGRAYRRALRPLFRRTALIPHAEYRFPYLGPVGNALALPALGLARGLRALATGELRVRHRPWPKWRVLVASEAMRAREAARPVADDVRRRLFVDDDPAAITASREEWYALRRLMLTQLGEVLRVDGSAPSA